MPYKGLLCSFAPLLFGISGALCQQGGPGALGPSCTPPETASLPVLLRAQKTELWCWAASGQMIMEYLGRSVDQCVQVNNRLQRALKSFSQLPLVFSGRFRHGCPGRVQVIRFENENRTAL